MIGKRVLSQEAVSLAEVKEITEARQKEGELTYEQTLTLDYCKKFARIDKKKAEELIAEVEGLDKLSRKHAISLADLLPSNADEIKLLFSKEHFVLSDEEISKILDIVGKYRG
ncbi:MAG: RNA polymerase Rpb4 family protein [archaeon]|jgi:DNA-directed RNA polymerase subunit F|nr:DNA-directed RNA polymerase subunit F [Euryarchaeota archaeon]MDP6704594.1 RNA polymerase Rpb4 family protein [archaeon]HIK01237.1 DNA-directed RNA polymerase subunit F [Candidatus Undinarchaeales archaeon ERR594346 U_76725]|tara:strand:- start:7657 stop:7995 length:339 start_codon:yes stop_codon:yes gene_type:complete